MLKLLNMCLFFNCKKCFSSVGTGTPYMMIWDCCLPLSHAPADSLTHLQSDGQNGIEFLVMKLKLLVSQGGGESGLGVQAGRDRHKMSLSAWARRPDSPPMSRSTSVDGIILCFAISRF